jgi:hypothetical protein
VAESYFTNVTPFSIVLQPFALSGNYFICCKVYPVFNMGMIEWQRYELNDSRGFKLLRVDASIMFLLQWRKELIDELHFK